MHLHDINQNFNPSTIFKIVQFANKGNMLNNLDYLDIQKSFKVTDCHSQHSTKSKLSPNFYWHYIT